MASTSTTQLDSSLFGPGSRQIAEIIPDFLYLSDIKCASDDTLLAQYGFTHVISILSAPIPWLGPSPSSTCRVLNVKCDDSDEEDIISHFEITNRFIEDAYRETLSNRNNTKRNKILCHCLAGVSRSPTVIAAYLMASRGMKRDEALDLLRERRCVVEPNPGFVEQLGVYEARVRKSKVLGFATSSTTGGSGNTLTTASSVSAVVGTQGSASPSGLVLNAITQRPRNHLVPHLTLSVASG